jgi:hypothetical protein
VSGKAGAVEASPKQPGTVCACATSAGMGVNRVAFVARCCTLVWTPVLSVLAFQLGRVVG